MRSRNKKEIEVEVEIEDKKKGGMNNPEKKREAVCNKNIWNQITRTSKKEKLFHEDDSNSHV